MAINENHKCLKDVTHHTGQSSVERHSQLQDGLVVAHERNTTHATVTEDKECCVHTGSGEIGQLLN